MKRKIIALGTLAVVVGAGFTACGSKPDAQGLLKESITNMASAKSLSLNYLIDMEPSIGMGGSNIHMNTNIGMKADFDMQAENIYMSMDVDMNMFGQKQSQKEEIYLITDGNNKTVYSSDKGTWYQYSQEYLKSTINPESLQEFAKNGSESIKFIEEEISKGNLKISNGADTKVNDKDAYGIDITMNGNFFKDAVEKGNSSGMDFLKDVKLDEINMTTQYYVYKDTKLPAKISIKAADAISTIAKESIKASSSQASTGTFDISQMDISFNKSVIEVEFKDYDQVSITVPESVKKSAKKVDGDQKVYNGLINSFSMFI